MSSSSWFIAAFVSVAGAAARDLDAKKKGSAMCNYLMYSRSVKFYTCIKSMRKSIQSMTPQNPSIAPPVVAVMTILPIASTRNDVEGDDEDEKDEKSGTEVITEIKLIVNE